MNSTKLIDAAKAGAKIESDYKLAKAIGVSTGRISSIRAGTQKLDAAEAMQLADMAGIAHDVAIAVAELDRTQSATKRTYLEKIARPFFASAALLLVCLGGQPADVHAASFTGGKGGIRTHGTV